MTQLKMLTTDDKIAEIRRLYFSATRQTIERDLDKALSLLKSIPGEEDRERATVFMEGLAEMRRDWSRPERDSSRPVEAARLRKRGNRAGAESRNAAAQERETRNQNPNGQPGPGPATHRGRKER